MEHFRHFMGFGEDGKYLSYHKKDPVKVVEEILPHHRGKTVELRYNEICRDYKPEFRYTQAGIFTPHYDEVKIP